MSKPLAISAAFSVFAMAAFVLSATPAQPFYGAHMETGATTHAAAPASDPLFQVVSGLVN